MQNSPHIFTFVSSSHLMKVFMFPWCCLEHVSTRTSGSFYSYKILQWRGHDDCLEAKAGTKSRYCHCMVRPGTASGCNTFLHLILATQTHIHTHILEVMRDLILNRLSHYLLNTFLEAIFPFHFFHFFRFHVRVIIRSLPLWTSWLE